MPPFIVVVVYNYRIAYFVEVFLYQLAQQVKLHYQIYTILLFLRFYLLFCGEIKTKIASFFAKLPSITGSLCGILYSIDE